MDTRFFSCDILGHTVHTDSVSSYITVDLLFDGCDYLISQKQEEGNILWKPIGVNRAHQVFKYGLCKKEGLYPITYRAAIIFCPF